MKELLEKIKFNQDGLIPAILQDIDSNEVLMLAYMNKEALQKTLETERQPSGAVPARNSGSRESSVITSWYGDKT